MENLPRKDAWGKLWRIFSLKNLKIFFSKAVQRIPPKKFRAFFLSQYDIILLEQIQINQ